MTLSFLQLAIAEENEDPIYLQDLAGKIWSRENQIALPCIAFGVVVLILLFMCLINERARRVSHIKLLENGECTK